MPSSTSHQKWVEWICRRRCCSCLFNWNTRSHRRLHTILLHITEPEMEHVTKYFVHSLSTAHRPHPRRTCHTNSMKSKSVARCFLIFISFRSFISFHSIHSCPERIPYCIAPQRRLPDEIKSTNYIVTFHRFIVSIPANNAPHTHPASTPERIISYYFCWALFSSVFHSGIWHHHRQGGTTEPTLEYCFASHSCSILHMVYSFLFSFLRQCKR